MKKKRRNIPFFTFLVIVFGLLIYGFAVGLFTFGLLGETDRDSSIEARETLNGDEETAEQGDEEEPRADEPTRDKPEP